MDKQQDKLQLILKIEKELKLMIYTQSTISLITVSDARSLEMIGFIGRVYANKKVIGINEENTYELYFIFDRFVALELNDDCQYSIAWTLYPHEVDNIDKMIQDAEKLAGFQ